MVSSSQDACLFMYKTKLCRTRLILEQNIRFKPPFPLKGVSSLVRRPWRADTTQLYCRGNAIGGVLSVPLPVAMGIRIF